MKKKAPILILLNVTEMPRCLKPFQEEKGPRPSWVTKVEEWNLWFFGSGIAEEEEE